MIETLEVALQRAVHERATVVREQLRSSIRPIVACESGGNPVPLGTCTLVEVDDRQFVVTASHVLDALPKNALFVIGTPGTEPLQMRGKIVQTAIPAGGDRRCDKIDIGFWEVNTDAVKRLGRVRFLRDREFSANRAPTKGRQYMAMGFPCSRNKGAIDNVLRKITPTIRTYTSQTVENPLLAKELGVTGEGHFILDFQKFAFYADGGKTTTFAPTGMSGGALVDLGSFIDVENYEPSTGSGRIAGVLIEWHKRHNAIVALKIDRVAQAIRKGRDLV
jgi:hypothetical protein